MAGTRGFMWGKYITIDYHWRSLSGGLNRELALEHPYPACIKGNNTSLLRVDSSFSFMPYYPSDLKSLSPTNAVKICTMNVQTPPVQCGPYLTPPPLRTNALLSCAAWLSAFVLCFANAAVVFRRNNLLRYGIIPKHWVNFIVATLFWDTAVS